MQNKTTWKNKLRGCQEKKVASGIVRVYNNVTLHFEMEILKRPVLTECRYDIFWITPYHEWIPILRKAFLKCGLYVLGTWYPFAKSIYCMVAISAFF